MSQREENLKILKNKMRGHDWFYSFSEDQKAYQKGLLERAEILTLFGGVPEREAENLILDFVPKEIQPEFVKVLSIFDRSRS